MFYFSRTNHSYISYISYKKPSSTISTIFPMVQDPPHRPHLLMSNHGKIAIQSGVPKR